MACPASNSTMPQLIMPHTDAAGPSSFPAAMPQALGRQGRRYQFPPGRVLVFNRSGNLVSPLVYGQIPPSGYGVIDVETGAIRPTQSAFLSSRGLPESYTLRYINGPLKNRTCRQARALVIEHGLKGTQVPLLEDVETSKLPSGIDLARAAQVAATKRDLSSLSPTPAATKRLKFVCPQANENQPQNMISELAVASAGIARLASGVLDEPVAGSAMQWPNETPDTPPGERLPLQDLPAQTLALTLALTTGSVPMIPSTLPAQARAHLADAPSTATARTSTAEDAGLKSTSSVTPNNSNSKTAATTAAATTVTVAATTTATTTATRYPALANLSIPLGTFSPRAQRLRTWTCSSPCCCSSSCSRLRPRLHHVRSRAPSKARFFPR